MTAVLTAADHHWPYTSTSVVRRMSTNGRKMMDDYDSIRGDTGHYCTVPIARREIAQ